MPKFHRKITKMYEKGCKNVTIYVNQLHSTGLLPFSFWAKPNLTTEKYGS